MVAHNKEQHQQPNQHQRTCIISIIGNKLISNDSRQNRSEKYL